MSIRSQSRKFKEIQKPLFTGAIFLKPQKMSEIYTFFGKGILFKTRWRANYLSQYSEILQQTIAAQELSKTFFRFTSFQHAENQRSTIGSSTWKTLCQTFPYFRGHKRRYGPSESFSSFESPKIDSYELKWLGLGILEGSCDT